MVSSKNNILKMKGKYFLSFSVIVTNTARHRRRHQMLPMMILGVLIFGIIVIPTGFQFLAVLGGKAFLMAKMALLLASINGLKRVIL